MEKLRCSSGGVESGGIEDDWVLLYRGVHDEHPGFAEALRGIARPRGGHDDPVLHNSWDTASQFTSWTADRAIAMEAAADDNGVILEMWFHKSELVHTPDAQAEDEILIRRVVVGAKVTRP